MKVRVPRVLAGNEIVLDQFVSTKLFLPEPPPPRINFKNVHNLMYLYVSHLALALCVLLFEVVKNKLDRAQVRVVHKSIKRKRVSCRRRWFQWLMKKLFNPVTVV